MDYIIVGLGNPGVKYEGTRHNVGFMAIDAIYKKHGRNSKVKKIQFKSLTAEITISDKKILLIKPTTYMNNSGEAVVEAMRFYKTPIENVIVIYDDISLNLSKLRIRKKGSDGGHNGIKSIIYLTGLDDFPRIKLGVGGKPNISYDLADWVLSSFKRDEYESITEAVNNAVICVELMVAGKTDEAMNKYNS